MDKMIEIFSELGKRLEHFGEEHTSQEVVRRAIEENEWFTREDILLAIKAIREEFLSTDKLHQWASNYHQPTPRKVAIIMAGNIPLVGFYDLLCVLMAGHTALVKPSSKDRVLTQYIINQLLNIEPSIPILDYTEDSSIDIAIATGGDQAARYFSARYANLPTIIRGSRHSLTLLDGNESKEEIEALCQDISSYNGLGCRSISLIMLPTGVALPQALHQELSSPSEMHRANYRHTKAMRTMLSQPFQDGNGYIFVEEPNFSDCISQINILRYDSLSDAEHWILQNDNRIQCIVSNLISHPRRVAFGRAQYPTLWDVADGIDVMNFLTQQ